jgi:CRISPR-associated protein Cas1
MLILQMDLILNTFGVSLGREKEGFIVTSPEGKQRIPADAIKSIQVCKGVHITSDAVFLAIEKEIDLVFVERNGNPAGRVWSHKYGSISTIRKGQLNFSRSSSAVEWIKKIIIKKIQNQQALLLMFESDDIQIVDKRDRAITRLEDYILKIKRLEGLLIQDVASTLRGWEGVSSKIYFDAVNEFLPQQYQFSQRSQHPAMDVPNAMLNYGYGILYSKIESALIKAGIDPYIGVLHRDEYNRPVLAYDVIEIYRVWIDYVVFNLLTQEIITDDFYSIKSDGSFWLENLGKRVLIQSVNDYFDEVVSYDASVLNRSRNTQLQLYANNLAQTFKKHE